MGKEFPCKICGKVCKTPQALGMHEHSHKVGGIDEKGNKVTTKMCPECNRPFKTYYLPTHRLQQHNVPKEVTYSPRHLKGELAYSGIKFCPECGANIAAYEAARRLTRA